MNVNNNRFVGLVLITVGVCWYAVFPAFLCFMVSMEGSADPGRHDATWRLWRAMEVLLIEPVWLAYTLTFLLLAPTIVGTAFLAVGIPTLVGKPRAPKLTVAAIAVGVAYCGIGLAVHWLLLMPVVRASDNPVVANASSDLNLVIPVALAAGLVSMIVAGVVALVPWRQMVFAGKLSASR